MERGKKKQCLVVGLITVIVSGSTAHPADLAELLALISSKNFECGSIWIDKCVVVVNPIRGSLRIGMKGSAIRKCLKDRIHCGDNNSKSIQN